MQCHSVAVFLGVVGVASSWSIPACISQPPKIIGSASSRSTCISSSLTIGRRQAVTSALSAAALGFSTPAHAIAKDMKKLNEDIVLILRVQEAAAQETRLVKTGKYKEVQRLNIKRAGQPCSIVLLTQRCSRTS